ncbi:DUF5713 family protein [Hymenobacter psychrophilus]|uniref:Uncharacterized protein n=1 Tax=Hymenobacter psychrophilus TaxID=651662 RepID=A0A1H3J228_9BACT|nr:DUF5713 family protein [Hymenobacter psychrophilus]SDY33645.1 hypothetical protein SAMN04488069_107241 [Hymenobacter psychrophilus]
MQSKKLPADFFYLVDMYQDDYFPAFLVDKIKGAIEEVVGFLEKGQSSETEIQAGLDQMTSKINDLQDEFEENDSEIETGARESIAATVEEILRFFEVGIATEEAIREWDW